MKDILILEDDLALCQGITLALQNENINFIQCHTLAQARKELLANAISIAILDVNLPDGNGLDLLREIRQSSTLPVILLTANDMEMDVVVGLELGADDYITKPFSLAILRARVHTQLRKQQILEKNREAETGKTGVSGQTDFQNKTTISESVMKIGEFLFDFDHMEFMRSGEKIELSKTEQKLLRILVQNRGQILTREILVDRIWTDGAEFVEENALSVAIKRLRDKLEESPSKPQYIKTVYGVGYTWSE